MINWRPFRAWSRVAGIAFSRVRKRLDEDRAPLVRRSRSPFNGGEDVAVNCVVFA